MQNRKRGRALERKEASEWVRSGWAAESNHPAKFVGPGKIVLLDFFNRYDLIAAAPGVTVYIQSSTESPSSHEPPMGFMLDNPDFTPDELMKVPERGRGVYEVYSYWRKLKGKGWVADRRWYVA